MHYHKTPSAAAFMLSLMILVLPVYSQNITNTLGPGGVFTIKDATLNFLTVNQSNGLFSLSGNLSLPSSTSASLGIITKGGNRFFHDFAPAGTQGGNTFVGIYSGNFSMSGSNYNSSYNTGVGGAALEGLTTGYRNTALGFESLSSNTTGFYNAGVGDESLRANTTGANNTAIGSETLTSNVSGSFNTAVGSASCHYVTASYNTAVGNSSLYSDSAGVNNTAMGCQSLYYDKTGTSNSAVGYQSLYSVNIGSGNTAVGCYAGSSITSGSNNTLIGNNAQPSAATISNEITLGNNAVAALRCQATAITSLSDARDKRNIRDLDLGIDFLMRLKPRLYNWDKREWYKDNKPDGSKSKKTPTAGFIAQELDAAQTNAGAEWLNLVLKSNPERLEATPGNLLPVMVKAIQELKVENNELKAKLEALEQLQSSLVREMENLKSSRGDVHQAVNISR